MRFLKVRILILLIWCFIVGPACQSAGNSDYPYDDSLYGAIIPSDEEINNYPKAGYPWFFPWLVPLGIVPSSAMVDNTPPVGMQGTAANPGSPGSCISWASSYGMATQVVNQTQQWGVDDPSHQVSPAFMYALISNQEGRSCPSGTSTPSYLNYLVQYGSISAADVPYEPNCSYLNSISLSLPPDPSFKIASWKTVSSTDRDTIRGYLASGFSLSFVTRLYEGFQSLSGDQVYYGSGPFEKNPNTGKLVGHSMLIIGYDDTLGDPEKGLGAYRIQNSMGTDWGDGGYLWMSYGTLEASAFSSFVAFPIGMIDDINGQPLLVEPASGSLSGKLIPGTQILNLNTSSPEVFLVFPYIFSEAVQLISVEVMDPSGAKTEYPNGAWNQEGYTYLHRSDGTQFLTGSYQVSFNVQTSSGSKVTLSGSSEVAALDGSDLPSAPIN